MSAACRVVSGRSEVGGSVQGGRRGIVCFGGKAARPAYLSRTHGLPVLVYDEADIN